jgi:hypothetical protein
MSTVRPFAYNPSQTLIDGTIQVGDLAVGTPTSGFTGPPQWWNGPDEDLGYVIAESVSGGTQPTNIPGVTASVGFFRTDDFLESSFINLAQTISTNQTFISGNEAYLWLSGNGYWSSWVFINPTPTPSATPTSTPTATPTATPTPTPTPTPSSTPGTGVTFSQTFTGGAAAGTTIENAWTTFRQSLTGSYTTFTWSSTNGSSITVTDSTRVQLIATALRTGTTGTNFTTTIGSNTWRVIQNCSVTNPIPAEAIEFTNLSACSCGSGYTIRPLIRNANWGGTNQSACGSPTQTITITFS